MRPVPLPCELCEAIDNKEAIVLIKRERINILSKTIVKSWTIVCNAGPTLKQDRVKIPCLLYVC